MPRTGCSAPTGGAGAAPCGHSSASPTRVASAHGTRNAAIAIRTRCPTGAAGPWPCPWPAGAGSSGGGRRRRGAPSRRASTPGRTLLSSTRSRPCRVRWPPEPPSSRLSGGSTRRRRLGAASRSSGSAAGRRWADRCSVRRASSAGARGRRGRSTGSSRSGRRGGGSARDLRVGRAPSTRCSPEALPSCASGAPRARRLLGPLVWAPSSASWGCSRAARCGRAGSWRNGPVPPGTRSGPGPDAPSVSGPCTHPSCQPCPDGRAGGGSSVRVAAGSRSSTGPWRGSGCSRTAPRESGIRV